MRSSSVRSTCFAAVMTGVVLSAGLMRESRGDTYYFTPTAYYVPATAAVIGPAYEITTSPWIATSYTPTTYATVYTPTTYAPVYTPTTYATVYTPTTYAAQAEWVEPTAYVRTVYERGLFRRRRVIVDRPLYAGYAETAYWLPSTYVAPRYRATVYEYPTVSESSYTLASAPICDDQVRPASTAASAGEDRLEPVAPEKAAASKPGDQGTISSSVGAVKPPAAKPPGAPAGAAVGATGDTTPPAPTVPSHEQSTIRPTAPAQPKPAAAPSTDAKAKDKPPVAPADAAPAGLDLQPAPPLGDEPGVTRRESLKPTYATPRPIRRAVLKGAVENPSGEAREEVSVSVASRDNGEIAHNGVTDAYGRFAIRLEDGEWTVNVTLPSGRRYSVRQITVKDGRVVDRAEGRDIPNLIITY